jgi:hypothetical protein
MQTITGASRVSIRAGDAGAVYVTVNGADPEVLGPSGRPLTREFVLVDAPGAPTAPDDVAPRTADPEPAPADESAAPLPAPRAAAPPVTPPTPAPLPAAPATPPQTASVPPPGAGRTAAAPVTGAAPVPGRTNAAFPTPQPASPTAALQPATAGTPQEDELVALSQRWLDAYLTGNSNTMLAVSGGTPDIRDQRPPGERLSPVSGIGAKRSFETPKLQRGADIGVFSVRMTERPAGAVDAGQEHVALVSQVWMRRTGKWQLIDVRIVSESQLKPQ